MADLFEEALASIGAGIGDIGDKYQEVMFGQPAPPTPAAPEATEEPGFGSLHREINVSPPREDADAFSEALATVIQAPIDPDIQPHGQAIDR